MASTGDGYGYHTLGVKPIINVMGAVTVLGGGTYSPRVTEAVDQANHSYAVVNELMDRAGEMIAEILGSEAAGISSGAHGALVMSIGAAMCGTDPEKISRIPDTTGMKNEVLTQKAAYWRDFRRAVTQTGAKLIEVGGETRCTPEELEAAIGPKTAAIVWYHGSRQDLPSDAIVPLEEVVRIGRRHSVPVIVDAAGHFFPLSRMRWYAQAADLVCFGSKYIGGPNSAGYVCGKKDLIDAANLQGSMGWSEMQRQKGKPLAELQQQGFHGGIGRHAKLDRSEIVAAVVSLQEWFEIDHDARVAESERRLKVIEDELKKVPHVETSVTGASGVGSTGTRIYPEGMPYLLITPDAQALGKTAADVAVELAQGDPAVWVQHMPGRRPDDILVVAEWGLLMEEEEYIVARRLREVFTGNSRPSPDVFVHHPSFVGWKAARTKG